jgi:hypothetical protein
MKHVAVLAAALAMMAAGDALGQKSEVQVQKRGEDSYVFVLRSVVSNTLAAAQQELLPEAKRICGDRLPRFGRYQFEHSEPVSPAAKQAPFLLKQEIQCINEASPPTTVVTSPNWRPTELEQGNILELTGRYFRFKDTGDYQQARQLLGPTLRFEDWLAATEKFNQQAGAVRHRKVEKVTWYKDPPNGPPPGIYAAVDFTGEFANIGIYCGYVVWYRGQDDMTRLLREEQNYISREVQQKMSADELAAARKKLRC